MKSAIMALAAVIALRLRLVGHRTQARYRRAQFDCRPERSVFR
jgi:hypothetical protein